MEKAANRKMRVTISPLPTRDEGSPFALTNFTLKQSHLPVLSWRESGRSFGQQIGFHASSNRIPIKPVHASHCKARTFDFKLDAPVWHMLDCGCSHTREVRLICI